MRDAENKTPGPESADAAGHPIERFGTTHWSVVLRAGAGDSKGRAAAFGQVYRTYWYPIYWFIRRHRGYDHHEAEDLTQAFFAHLLEAETLEEAARETGQIPHFPVGCARRSPGE